MLAFALHEQIIGHLHAVPALVAVHGIVAADDAGHGAGTLGAMILQLLDESLARAGVGVAAVHEAVQIHLLQAVVGRDVAQGEDMVERRVHAAVGCQAHQVQCLARLAGVFVGSLDLGIVQDSAALDSLVDFHQVLVHDTARADIEVTHLGVAHLAVGQTHALAAGEQLRVGIGLEQMIPVGSRSRVDCVGMGMVAQSPAIENYQ